jgi:hypothetical protein
MVTVVDREVAEQEFERFAEAMDLDIDESGFDDDEDRSSFNKNKKRIVRAIVKGHLVINEDGEAVYTPYHQKSKYKEPITFHERTGATLMEMDRKKKGHDVAKTYAMLTQMCKVPKGTFANLVGEDVKVCEAIFAFLMD